MNITLTTATSRICRPLIYSTIQVNHGYAKMGKGNTRQYYGSDPYNAWLGDEDEGQMGAWVVMSAMGLFETDGGASVKPFYEIGSPIFESVTIHLDPNYYSGKTFTIEAKNVSDKNRYLQSASLKRDEYVSYECLYK